MALGPLGARGNAHRPLRTARAAPAWEMILFYNPRAEPPSRRHRIVSIGLRDRVARPAIIDVPPASEARSEPWGERSPGNGREPGATRDAIESASLAATAAAVSGTGVSRIASRSSRLCCTGLARARELQEAGPASPGLTRTLRRPLRAPRRSWRPRSVSRLQPRLPLLHPFLQLTREGQCAANPRTGSAAAEPWHESCSAYSGWRDACGHGLETGSRSKPPF